MKVVWIDNNSSCKGVCTRIENINMTQNANPNDDLYSDHGYYDEAMLTDLPRYLAGDQDVLIVLHTLGSHDPTYHKRSCCMQLITGSRWVKMAFTCTACLIGSRLKHKPTSPCFYGVPKAIGSKTRKLGRPYRQKNQRTYRTTTYHIAC